MEARRKTTQPTHAQNRYDNKRDPMRTGFLKRIMHGQPTTAGDQGASPAGNPASKESQSTPEVTGMTTYLEDINTRLHELDTEPPADDDLTTYCRKMLEDLPAETQDSSQDGDSSFDSESSRIAELGRMLDELEGLDKNPEKKYTDSKLQEIREEFSREIRGLRETVDQSLSSLHKEASNINTSYEISEILKDLPELRRYEGTRDGGTAARITEPPEHQELAHKGNQDDPKPTSEPTPQGKQGNPDGQRESAPKTPVEELAEQEQDMIAQDASKKQTGEQTTQHKQSGKQGRIRKRVGEATYSDIDLAEMARPLPTSNNGNTVFVECGEEDIMTCANQMYAKSSEDILGMDFHFSRKVIEVAPTSQKAREKFLQQGIQGEGRTWKCRTGTPTIPPILSWYHVDKVKLEDPRVSTKHLLEAFDQYGKVVKIAPKYWEGSPILTRSWLVVLGDVSTDPPPECVQVNGYPVVVEKSGGPKVCRQCFRSEHKPDCADNWTEVRYRKNNSTRNNWQHGRGPQQKGQGSQWWPRRWTDSKEDKDTNGQAQNMHKQSQSKELDRQETTQEKVPGKDITNTVDKEQGQLPPEHRDKEPGPQKEEKSTQEQHRKEPKEPGSHDSSRKGEEPTKHKANTSQDQQLHVQNQAMGQHKQAKEQTGQVKTWGKTPGKDITNTMETQQSKPHTAHNEQEASSQAKSSPQQGHSKVIGPRDGNNRPPQKQRHDKENTNSNTKH